MIKRESSGGTLLPPSDAPSLSSLYFNKTLLHTHTKQNKQTKKKKKEREREKALIWTKKQPSPSGESINKIPTPYHRAGIKSVYWQNDSIPESILVGKLEHVLI